MTRCRECGYDWARSGRRAAALINAFPARLIRVLDNSGVEDADVRLRTKPTAGVWSPLEYMAHTADAIDWYTQRISRIITEHRPAFEPFDWDAHTTSRNYRERLLGEVLAQPGRPGRR